MSELRTGTIDLLIVDDHAMFREGLVRSLEKYPALRVVGQCSTSGEALALLDSCPAAIVLLDVDLGSGRALDFVVEARQKGFEGRILIVTAGVGDQEAVALVQAGVSGILHKRQTTDVLYGVIRDIAAGKVWLEDKYLGPLFRSVDRSRAAAPQFDERDKKLLRQVLQGLTNREIAARLDVTEGAVKAALHHVFQKLGVRTRSQLVKVVLEQYRDQL